MKIKDINFRYINEEEINKLPQEKRTAILTELNRRAIELKSLSEDRKPENLVRILSLNARMPQWLLNKIYKITE